MKTPSSNPTERELTSDPANDLLRLMKERSALAEAFRAHTGLAPDQTILCQRVAEDGTVRSWYERREGVCDKPSGATPETNTTS